MAEFGGRGNVRAVRAALRATGERLGLPLAEEPWYFPSVAEYAGLLEAAGLEVTFAALFDRPTPLEGEGGLRDWVRMFAAGQLEAVPAGRREEFLRAVEEAAGPQLRQAGGGWVADYRRLRVVAVRLA